jgi:hypothetical protein
MANRDVEWKSRSKTISGLIRELQSFGDQSLEVRISVDDGDTSYSISLVAKSGDRCLLIDCFCHLCLLAYQTIIYCLIRPANRHGIKTVFG